MAHTQGGGRDGPDPTPDGSGQDTPPPPRDVVEHERVYRALSQPRRRHVCYALFEATEWHLDDLATRIAAWEHDVPEHEVTPAQHEQMRLSLYHAHVPKLADDGILSYDPETGAIATGPHAATVLSALRGIGHALASTHEPHPEDGMGDDDAPRGRG